MADRASLTAREHGGQAPGVEREPGVPDRVHAAVHAVQPAGSHAPEDCVVVEARGKQLRERDHTVLARGQRRDHRVRCWGCAGASGHRSPSAAPPGHDVGPDDEPYRRELGRERVDHAAIERPGRRRPDIAAASTRNAPGRRRR